MCMCMGTFPKKQEIPNKSKKIQKLFYKYLLLLQIK